MAMAFMAAVVLTGLTRSVFCDSNTAGVILFGPPAVPQVLSLTMSGNGCPSAAAQNKNANWNEWTFNFGNFSAGDHDTAATKERNANCQIYISIASLGFFYLSNRWTLSTIFRRDLQAKEEIDSWGLHMVDVILSYLRP